MFNNLTAKVSNILQNVFYKCKLSGLITADPGTGNQTLLAYSRATGELIGATVWDSVAHTYVLYLQEHPDQGVMLTRRDESGIYFSETYDRLSLCTETFVHGSEYTDDLQNFNRSMNMYASKSLLSSYPFTIQHENLKKVSGNLSFISDLKDGKLSVSGSDYSLPKKIRGCVYADNDTIVYIGNNTDFFQTGHINPAININPFNDGSLIAAYPMATDGKDCTGNYPTIDFELTRFNKGGYNFYYSYHVPFTIPIVITRAATRTIVFTIEHYNWNSVQTELFTIPGLLYLTIFNGSLQFFSVSGTTWTSAAAYTLITPVWSTIQISFVVSSSGVDKLYVHGVCVYTKAVGVPTVTNNQFLSFNGKKDSSITEVVIKDVMIFNRELTPMEIGYLYRITKINTSVAFPSVINAAKNTSSSLTLAGSNIVNDLKARFPLNDGNLGNILGTSGGYSVSGGVSLYKTNVKFDGSTGYLKRSKILAWWDADDASTITIVTGVSKWLDKSGNGNNLVQATTTYQPSRQTNIINGRAVVRFDGTDDTLAISKLQFKTVSIFHVQKTTDTQYIVYSADTTFYTLAAHSADSALNNPLFGTMPISIRINGALSSVNSRAALYTALNNINAVVSYIGLDVTFWSSFRIGGFASWHPAMDLGEIIIVPGTPTKEVIEGIEGFLAHRWGTTASLPAGHTYKSTPPVGTLEEIVAGTDRVNFSTSDLSIKFYPSAVTAQCIYKKGNDLNGIAVGIDSTAHVTLYVRNSGVLTSSSFAAAVTTNAWFRFELKGSNITLYSTTDAVIETKAHGLTIGNYNGAESVGAAYGGSPILGTSGNSGFFNGQVSDILFTDSGTMEELVVDSENSISVYAGETECPVEVVKWDMENDEAILWANIPSISATEDTVLTLSSEVLPTKSGVTGTLAAQKVWDDDFVGVYHMIPGSKLIDSTENHFDGDLFNVDLTNFISHGTGYSLDLNGTDEYAVIKYPVLSDSQRASITAFFKCDSIADEIRLIDLALSDSQDNGQQLTLEFDASNNLTASFFDTSETLIGSVTSTAFGTVDDTCVTVNYDGKDQAGSLEMFVDGISADTDTPSGNRISNSAAKLHLGKDAYSADFFNGKLHELLISKKQRSEDFNKVIDMSMKDTLGEYTVQTSNQQTVFTVIVPTDNIDENLTDFPLCINFAPVPALVYPLTFDTNTCKVTSAVPGWDAYDAVNPANSVIGAADATNSWAGITVANNKFNIDYGTAKIATRMLLENYHSGGSSTIYGINNFSIYGSNTLSDFTDTNYSNMGDLVLLGTFQARQHVAANISDPQYFYFDNTTAYRYYILRIADCFTTGAPGARRISFFATDEVDVRSELFAQCDDPTTLVFKQDIVSLSAEIEQWDSANKKCIFHVKVPLVSSTVATEVAVTIGAEVNPLVGYPGDVAAQAVWDDNFIAVCHMRSASNPSINSAGGFNGTVTGTLTDYNDGEGGAISFNNNPANYLDFPILTEDQYNGGGGVTMEIFHKNSEQSTKSLVALGITASYNNVLMGSHSGTYRFIASSEGASWTHVVTLPSNAWNAGWQRTTVTYNNITGCVYHNDGSSNYTFASANFVIGTKKLKVGVDRSLASGYYGELKYFRYSNIVRSAAWVKATYYGLKGDLNTHTVEIIATNNISFNMTIPPDGIDENLIDFPWCIQFTPIPELVYPLTFDTNTVKATSYYDSTRTPWFAVNPALLVTGNYINNAWYSLEQNTNQKFNIDYGTAKIATRMLLENGHSGGAAELYGIKNFSIYGSNTADDFSNTVYADMGDLVLLGTFLARKHITVDTPDPQYFYFDNTTAYRYYILRIADNYTGSAMLIRRVSFLASDEVDVRPELFAQCDDPTKLTFTQGVTSLSAEIEQWDSVNNKCVFHVKIPTVSNAVNTVIKVTVGTEVNPLVGYPGDVAAQAVWDNNFVAVYHMSEDIITVIDSSNGGNPGTNNGAVLISDSFGSGLSMITNDYVNVPYKANLTINGTSGLTLECFADVKAATGSLIARDQISNRGYDFRIDQNYKLVLEYNGVSNYTGPTTNTSGYKHYAAINTGTTISLYLNGTLDGTTTGGQNIQPVGNIDTCIGRRNYAGYEQYVNGVIGEVRISNIVRSAAWLKATASCLRGTHLVSHEQTSDEQDAPLVTYINGFPWYNQYLFNITVFSDITGWSTSGTSFPINIAMHRTIITSSRVYVIGGRSGGAAIDSIYYAPINTDGTLGTWVFDTNSLPIPLAWFALVQVGVKVYTIGGFTTGDSAAQVILSATINDNGVLGPFSTDASTCPSGQKYSIAAVTKDRVYVFGGYTTVSINTVYYAPINQDGTLGSWVTDSNVLPYAVHQACVAVTSNRVFIIGGVTNSTELSSVLSATFDTNGVLGAFTATFSLPNGMQDTAVICTEGIMFVTGYTSWTASGIMYKTVINADGTINAWATATSIPQRTGHMNMVATSSKLYIIGGWYTSEKNTIYLADFSGGSNDYEGYTFENLTPESGSWVLWTPDEITTDLWLDADDATTISGDLSTWSDKSGNSKHATQANASLRPTYVSPYLRFSGNDQYMDIPQIPCGGSIGVFCVMKWNGGLNDDYRHILANNAFWHGGTTTSLFSGTYTNPLIYNGSAWLNGTSTAALSLLKRAATSMYSFVPQTGAYINGTGAQSSFPARCFYGDWCEIIVAPSEYREIIEGYLAWKWGLEIDLPVAHPYKTEAPGVFVPNVNASNIILFTIPSGTVQNNLSNVPVMLRLSSSSGISGMNVTAIFDKIKEDFLKLYGVNPKFNEFGLTRSATAGFDTPTITVEQGPRYENKGALRITKQASSYIDISNNISRSLLSGTITVSIWVFLDEIHAAETNLFGVGSEFLISYTASTGRIIIRHASTGITCNTSILPGRWNNIIVIRDIVAKTITVYHDNYLSYPATAYTNQPSVSATAIYIGSTTLMGRIADIQIFNRVLTSQEIYDLHRGSEYYIYKDNFVTSLFKQSVPVLLGENLTSIQATDNYLGSSPPVYTMINAQPWRQQYDFNESAITDITGWTSAADFPIKVYNQQAVVTKNRVYVIGGFNYTTSLAIDTVYVALINEDGTLGSWATGTPLPGVLTTSQAIVTKNRVYLLGKTDGPVVYTAPINEDGTLGNWTTDTSLPYALGNSQAIVTKNRVYLLGGWNSMFMTVDIVYTAPINEDGTLGAWTTGTSLPMALTYAQAIVTKNRVYLIGGISGGTDKNTVYTAPIDEDGLIGTWSLGTPLPYALYSAQSIVIKNRVFLIGGRDNTIGDYLPILTAPINEDGTLGSWATGSSIPAARTNGKLIATASRIYLIGNNAQSYSPAVHTAAFTGGSNDYLDKSYSVYYAPYTLSKGVWYALSSDGITYKVNTGIWKSIATSDPAVHGYAGDNNPYYWDADSSEWVYSNSSIEEAISNAVAYTENRMGKTALNAITDFSSVFSSSVGTLNIAATLFSDGLEKPEVTEIKINNKNYWVSEEYVLSDFCATVTESKVEYAFGIPNSTTDYLIGTKLYCLVTGGTQWVECVNGTIPNIPTGFVTAGKSAWFKLVWDYTVWGANALPDVSIQATII